MTKFQALALANSQVFKHDRYTPVSLGVDYNGCTSVTLRNMDKDGWRKFLELMARVTEPAVLEELSKLLFTAEERDAISKRIRIIEELLKEEKTQREIAADFKLSIAKITRGSNALKETSPKMKQFLKKKLT